MKKTVYAVGMAVLMQASAHATLIVGELQVSEGDVLPDPIVAVNDDLLQTDFGSVVGGPTDPADEAINRDGVTGTAREGGTMAGLWFDTGGAVQTDYFFDLSTNTQGYDIEDVRVFTGWDSNRAQAGYNLSYSLVGDAGWTVIGTVLSPADQGAVNSSADASFMTRTYDDAGGIIGLSGVDGIRFDWDFSDNASSGTRGPVIREIDVLGTATIPEPGTMGLIAVSGLGIMILRRFRK